MFRHTLAALAVFGLTSVFTGCAGSLGDNAFATGSSTVVADASGKALYAVNVDEGTVSRYDDSVTAECSTGGAIGTTEIAGAPLFPGFPGFPTTLDVSLVSFAIKASQL